MTIRNKQKYMKYHCMFKQRDTASHILGDTHDPVS